MTRRDWRLVTGNLAAPPAGFEATVEDYARVYLGGLTPAWRSLVSRVFDALGVSWMLDRRLDRLSEGQRSLAVTLVALARPSPLVLLDEPFSHLDPSWRCRLLALLVREARSRIILYTTHEFDTPLYADTVSVVAGGRLVAMGAPRDTLLREGILESVYGVRFVRLGGVVHPVCGADESRAIHRLVDGEVPRLNTSRGPAV